MILFAVVQELYTLLAAGFGGSLWSDLGVILAIWGLPPCVAGVLPPSCGAAGAELPVPSGSAARGGRKNDPVCNAA